MFAAVAAEDTRKEVESMAAKVLKMKLWPDETGATVCNIDLLSNLDDCQHRLRNGRTVYKTFREKFSVVSSPVENLDADRG